MAATDISEMSPWRRVATAALPALLLSVAAVPALADCKAPTPIDLAKPDLTADLQAALDRDDALCLTAGTFHISDTLRLVRDAQLMSGAGRGGRTRIINATNDKPLIEVGDREAGRYARRVAISDLHLVGNVATRAGLTFLGIRDDGLKGDASKAATVSSISISGIGSGPALRVSSWANTFQAVEIYDSRTGIVLGAEANANVFVGTYITNTAAEAVLAPQESRATPVNNVFISLVAQQGGGTAGAISILRAVGTAFTGLYLERNNEKGAKSAVYVGNRAVGTRFESVTHVSGPKADLRPVFIDMGQSTSVRGVSIMGDVSHGLVTASADRAEMAREFRVVYGRMAGDVVSAP